MPIDMSAAAKAPPRKVAARKVAVTPDVGLSLADQRHEGLMGLASLGQGLCLMTGQYADAMAVGHLFPPVAREVANLANRYESVAKPVDFLIHVGPFTALITAAMPLILQIAANHRLVDASRLASQGVVPPQVLESQMVAEIARMQAEAKRQQQQAMREAQEATADYERFMAEYEADKAA